MKKGFLFFLILCGLFISKPIFEKGLGTYLQWKAKKKYHVDLAFDSLVIKGTKVQLNKLVFQHENLEAYVEKAFYNFNFDLSDLTVNPTLDLKKPKIFIKKHLSFNSSSNEKKLPISVEKGKIFAGSIKTPLNFSYNSITGSFEALLKEGKIKARIDQDKLAMDIANLDLSAVYPFATFFHLLSKDLKLKGTAKGSVVVPFTDQKVFCDLSFKDFIYEDKVRDIESKGKDITVKLRGDFDKKRTLKENLEHLNTFLALSEASFSSKDNSFEINSINGFCFLDSLERFQCGFSAKAQNNDKVIPLILEGKNDKVILLNLDFLQTRDSDEARLSFSLSDQLINVTFDSFNPEKKKIIDLFYTPFFPDFAFNMSEGSFEGGVDLVFLDNLIAQMHFKNCEIKNLKLEKAGCEVSLDRACLSGVYNVFENLFEESNASIENGRIEKENLLVDVLEGSIEVFNRKFLPSVLKGQVNQTHSRISFEGVLPNFSANLDVRGNLLSLVSSEEKYIGQTRVNIRKKDNGLFWVADLQTSTDKIGCFAKTTSFYDFSWDNLEFFECKIDQLQLQNISFLFDKNDLKGELSGTALWDKDHFSLQTSLNDLLILHPSYGFGFNDKIEKLIGTFYPKDKQLNFSFPFTNAHFILSKFDLNFNDIQGDLTFENQQFQFEIALAEIDKILFSAGIYLDPRGRIDIDAFNITSNFSEILHLSTKLGVLLPNIDCFEGKVTSDSLVYSYLFKDEPQYFFSIQGAFEDFQGNITENVHADKASGVFCFDTESNVFALSDTNCVLEVDQEEPIFAALDKLEAKGSDICFDMTLDQSFLEIMQLQGSINTENSYRIELMPTSHLYGEALKDCVIDFDSEGFLELSLETKLSITDQKTSLIKNLFGLNAKLPVKGDFVVDLSLDTLEGKMNLEGSNLELLDIPFDRLLLEVEKENDRWSLAKGLLDSWDVIGNYENKSLLLKGEKKDVVTFRLDSKIERSSDLTIELLSANFPKQDLEFSVKGQLLLDVFKETPFTIDGDFELVHSGKWKDFEIKNQSPINLHFSVQDQLQVGGIDCLLFGKSNTYPIHFDTTLLEIDFRKEALFAKKSAINVPREFHLGKEYLGLEIGQVDLVMNIESSFDKVVLNVEKGSIDEKRCLSDLVIEGDRKTIQVQGDLLVNAQKIPFETEVHYEKDIDGSFTLFDPNDNTDDPLSFYWHYDDGIMLDCLSGNFSGLDLEFCSKDKGKLIGKSRIDFNKLSTFLTPDLKELLVDGLEMKEGYYLTGTLNYDPKNFSLDSFQGYLSGKDFSFFGYKLKTLFSELTWNQKGLFISHLKMSDDGGMLHVDSFSCIKQKNQMLLDIPEVLFEDIRPSLLTSSEDKNDEKEIDPLLIKKLSIEKITGDMNDMQTITGNGSMEFINSFTRGSNKSLFDLPSEVFGKIFGLDLELLIPVKGSLDFVIEDKKFLFKELKNTYSENKRSQFFLYEKATPYMDFNANLHVNIRMEQFVLFKLTEQLILSISGDIYHPKVGLASKSNFE